MRTWRWLVTGGMLLTGVLEAAGDSASAPVTAKTADVEITARLILGREEQIKAVDSDLGRQYVIVEMTVKPRGYPLALSRDDFLLRSERDNERSTADSPDRVAGPGVLVLGSTGGAGPIYSESRDPIYAGGYPGTGTGPPRRIPGPSTSVGIGGDSKSTSASPSSRATPLLATLRGKELPIGETGKTVSGLLYFQVSPNQKTKNFHLHYKGAGGSCELRFK